MATAVCYIEVDSYGHLVHLCRNPGLVRTPVVNIAGHRDKDGKPEKTADGRSLGPFGHAMSAPIRITEQQFREIQINGMDHYLWNHAKKKLEKVL